MRAGLALCGWLVGVGACSPFASADTSTAASTDAGTGSEAAAAPPLTEAGVASTTCPAVFCDAFERDPNDVMGSWSTLTHNGVPSGVAQLDGKHFQSGAQAFHAGVTVLTNSSGPELLLDEPATLATTTTYSFSFYAEDTSRHTNIGQLGLIGDVISILVFGFSNSSVFVGRQSNDKDTGTTSLPNLGYHGLEQGSTDVLPDQWHTVVIKVTPGVAAPIASFTLDDKPVPLADGGTMNPVTGVTTLRAGCGTNYAMASKSGVDVWFDDVSLDLSPR